VYVFVYIVFFIKMIL